LIDGMSATDEPRNLDWLESADPSGEGAVAQDEPRLPRAPNPEVFMFNVVSREPAGFKGEDILHILLACDLRFGDMSFFHRHEQEAGRGPIQFSVANMMQPGVFDIDNMADFDTPGLVFFLTLPGPEDMMQAFEYMLETAQAVSRNLSGDVLDESRSAVTKQALDHSRQQIRDLERRMLTQAQH
jgi:cell division protein ZipA